jgi:hypothetical protein
LEVGRKRRYGLPSDLGRCPWLWELTEQSKLQNLLFGIDPTEVIKGRSKYLVPRISPQ